MEQSDDILNPIASLAGLAKEQPHPSCLFSQLVAVHLLERSFLVFFVAHWGSVQISPGFALFLATNFFCGRREHSRESRHRDGYVTVSEVGQGASVTTDYCQPPFNRLGCHMLAGVVSNAITGAGQETIELGITASGDLLLSLLRSRKPALQQP